MTFHIVGLDNILAYLLSIFVLPECLTRTDCQIKDHESSVAATLVSRLTCSAALPDTGKQDTDTDIVTADILHPCNVFAMLQHVINGQIYYYYYYYY